MTHKDWTLTSIFESHRWVSFLRPFTKKELCGSYCVFSDDTGILQRSLPVSQSNAAGTQETIYFSIDLWLFKFILLGLKNMSVASSISEISALPLTRKVRAFTKYKIDGTGQWKAKRATSTAFLIHSLPKLIGSETLVHDFFLKPDGGCVDEFFFLRIFLQSVSSRLYNSENRKAYVKFGN